MYIFRSDTDRLVVLLLDVVSVRKILSPSFNRLENSVWWEQVGDCQLISLHLATLGVCVTHQNVIRDGNWGAVLFEKDGTGQEVCVFRKSSKISILLIRRISNLIVKKMLTIMITISSIRLVIVT